MEQEYQRAVTRICVQTALLLFCLLYTSRGYTEADLVKKELQALGIASVYISSIRKVNRRNTECL